MPDDAPNGELLVPDPNVNACDEPVFPPGAAAAANGLGVPVFVFVEPAAPPDEPPKLNIKVGLFSVFSAAGLASLDAAPKLKRGLGVSFA